MIKLMVEEEVQKCLREKVRDIVAKKLLNQTEKIEQLVTESLNNLISAETETYDAVYDHITGAECLTVKSCAPPIHMNFAKGTRKLIPDKCATEPKYFAVKSAKKNTEFKIHKYPSDTDPSVIVSEIRRGKLMGINIIINNTCDCVTFKAACLPKTEIEDYKVPTCEHMEFVKGLKMPIATDP